MGNFPAPKKEAPLAATGGASRDSFGGLSQHPPSLALQRAQFLTLAYSIRPDMAVLIGALVFEGGAQ